MKIYLQYFKSVWKKKWDIGVIGYPLLEGNPYFTLYTKKYYTRIKG